MKENCMFTTNFKLPSQIKENAMNFVILLQFVNFCCEWTLSLLTQGAKKTYLHHCQLDLYSFAKYKDHCVKHSLIVIQVMLLISYYDQLYVTKFNSWDVHTYNN
jgi:hypothetical protein